MHLVDGIGIKIINPCELISFSKISKHYLPLEVLNGMPLNDKTDIWSAGVILFELISGTVPIEYLTEKELLKKVYRADYNYGLVTDGIPSDLEVLAKQILLPKCRYRKRWTVIDCLQFPYINEILKELLNIKEFNNS